MSNMALKLFAAIATVPQGTGDYGTDCKTFFQGKCTYYDAMTRADEHYKSTGQRVRIFVGMDLGRMVYDTQEWVGVTL